MNVKVLTVLVSVVIISEQCNNVADTCESDVYCRGKLLHDVQMARIFPDSKTFVDKKMKYPEDKIVESYKELMLNYNGGVPAPVLKQFVDRYFEDSNELEVWEPEDWKKEPRILDKIKDSKFKDWASQLNVIWKNLSRKIIDDVREQPDLYSLIYVPNGFVIPGGRFTELYYWDTYWIVNGLLICDMKDTARGVIENLLYLIKNIGHIPNGNRLYYLQRSQPPMITQMVNSYLQHTRDFDFVKKNLLLLDKEMDYWRANRIVDVNKKLETYTLFRYFAPSNGPRPESYREDVLTAELAATENVTTDKAELFIDIKSAAESGWDFSTRWFIENGTNQGNLTDIQTRYIIPVDLNAILQNNAKLLSKWFGMIKDKKRAKKYENLSKHLLKGIKEILWNEEEGIWFDYDLLNQKPRNYFYVSNFVPFWTNSHEFSPKEAEAYAINYVNKMKLADYIGGTPASLVLSGEQWDFPNVWPPLQAFFIQGLDRIGTKNSSKLAFQFALKYVRSNYKGFQDFGVMFEKYDALALGRTGGGGEYEAQSGFGWTNGFMFELLDKWGMELTSSNTRRKKYINV